MNPVLFFAAAALILVALGKSKTDKVTGKVDPNTCLPFVAQKLAADMPPMALPFQLPQTAQEILAYLATAQPPALRLLASALRSAGKVNEAECLEAYALELEKPQPPVIPGPPGPMPPPGPGSVQI